MENLKRKIVKVRHIRSKEQESRYKPFMKI